MKIQTYQSKEVLDILNSSGFYKPQLSLVKYEHLKPIYEKLQALFGWDNPPVFCFYGNFIDGYFPSCDEVLITLDVPESELKITEFYNWSDYIFFSLENSEEEKDFLKAMEKDMKNQRPKEKYDNPQVLIPHIKKEWVKEVLQKQ